MPRFCNMRTISRPAGSTPPKPATRAPADGDPRDRTLRGDPPPVPPDVLVQHDIPDHQDPAGREPPDIAEGAGDESVIIHRRPLRRCGEWESRRRCGSSGGKPRTGARTPPGSAVKPPCTSGKPGSRAAPRP